MHLYESKVTRESVTVPKVRFTLRKMSEGRRRKLRLSLAGSTAKLQEILAQVRRLSEETPVNAAEVRRVQAEFKTLIDDEITPAWVRWGLQSVDGLLIDGEPATVESLIEEGPQALYEEIAAAVKEIAGLSGEAQGESGPLTTSGVLVDGRTSDSIVESAGDKGTTEGGTVVSISPTT